MIPIKIFLDVDFGDLEKKLFFSTPFLHGVTPPATAGPVLCPKCNSPMRLRSGKNGQFYGCTSFPQCNGTRNADGVATGISAASQSAAIRCLKAAVLANEDECLIFKDSQLLNVDDYELHVDPIPEETSYIVTVRRKKP